ncbi:BON domain-containing protein [Novipirellula rosea]|uniref:BON domain-containing protein n=1 Tax=Novipirellula rosea TaxID=1031540 RepID=A0ABP8NDF2_9BACT|tara:strand:+ start:15355 stop:16017 length:663 start_codon:yes stop_codon:yes gene_type:complete
MIKRDDEITQDATAQLKWDSRVNADDVKVTVLDRVVVLEGTVPTFWAKLAAEEDCELVSGVQRVDNLLDVRWSLDKEPLESDLCTKVEQALEANPNVDAIRVTVSSSGGEVSLKGSVDSLWRKRLIEHVTSDTIGVRRVDNQLTIVPTGVIEDEVISSHIRDAIRRNMLVEADAIEVHVTGGTASLSGRVKSRAAQRAAHDIAIHTSGVLDVQDHLVVAV